MTSATLADMNAGTGVSAEPTRLEIFPEGWFRLANSDELRPGEHLVRMLNGTEVVLFRAEGGAIGALHPTCPHLGAHLGHGGRVVGDALRCPFHGIRFGVEGRCVGTEYAESPTAEMRAGAWPVVERYGFIFIFFSVDRRIADWYLPTLDMEGWTAPHIKTLRLEGHVQDTTENAVDLGHLGAVHDYFNIRDPELRIEGTHLHSRFGFDRKNPFLPRGDVSAVFDTDVHGLGFSLTDLVVEKLGIHYRLFLLASQVDATHFDFTVGVSSEMPPPMARTALRFLPIPWRLATAGMVRLTTATVLQDILQDKEIWAHKVHLDSPQLLKGDGPIGKFRRYARQFYPSAAGPST